MWQYIITGIIIAAALGVAIYRIIKYFTDPLRKCRKCNLDCGGCPLEGLKDVKKKGRRK